MADYTEILAKTDFFADAPYDALEAIAASGTERHLVRGDVLFSEGDPPEAIYLVLQGASRSRSPTSSTDARAWSR